MDLYCEIEQRKVGSCQVMKERDTLRAEVERLTKEDACGDEMIMRMDATIMDQAVEITRLRAEVERLRGLCGISAAVIRKMENTANQIIGSHKHVHALRDACGWEHTKCGIAWLEAAERKEGQ
jgi:hypothetical protein